MVNIKAIITIDVNHKVVVHKSWEEVQQWGLNNAKTPEAKSRVADQIRELIKKSRDLEEKYFLPRGSLEGIHLITGSSEELTNKLHRLDIVNLLTNPSNVFVVKIRENDPIIRTSIHTARDIIEWEFVNDDIALLNWRNVRFRYETVRPE